MIDALELDSNGNGMLSIEEFEQLLVLPEAAQFMQGVGVDVVGLVEFSEFIFKERELAFPEFVELILQLRGSNNATVKDIVDMRKQVMQELDCIGTDVVKMMEKQSNVVDKQSAIHATIAEVYTGFKKLASRMNVHDREIRRFTQRDEVRQQLRSRDVLRTASQQRSRVQSAQREVKPVDGPRAAGNALRTESADRDRVVRISEPLVSQSQPMLSLANDEAASKAVFVSPSPQAVPPIPSEPYGALAVATTSEGITWMTPSAKDLQILLQNRLIEEGQ